MTIKRFRAIILGHYKEHGRSLPWRRTRDPYAILVSEVMLQQTQVGRVEGYYANFLKRFPDFRSLARARNSAVLAAWQGLGYNRRALALKRTAEIVVRQYKGKLPRERAALEALPGIGKGTSGSLTAFVWNEPVVFIETNIRRVFLHFFFPKRRKVTDDALTRYIQRTLDKQDPRTWYWALMDYGALMKARLNPNRRSAHYKKQAPFSGSDRELRGRVVRIALSGKKISERSLAKILQTSPERIRTIARGLAKEGLIEMKGKSVYIQ